MKDFTYNKQQQGRVKIRQSLLSIAKAEREIRLNISKLFFWNTIFG
jgi:hypothetical protein